MLKLGLKVNQDQIAVPSLSRLHLSAKVPHAVNEAVAALHDFIVREDGEELIKDDHDIFVLETPKTWSMKELKESLVATSDARDEGADSDPADAEDRILDYSAIRKRVVVHEKGLPPTKETPYFNHDAYFANLEKYQEEDESMDPAFGRLLLYSEVITSTNSILEKSVPACLSSPAITPPTDLTPDRNTQLLRRLPAGFLATATVQVAGRGRGSNVWVSPAGSLMFSLVVRHPMALMPRAPVVFLQYLAALAVVEGVHTYVPGCGELPIRLKWPNDICMRKLCA